MPGTKSRSESKRRDVPPNSSTVLLLTIADTTWRLFIPSIGCTLLGVWLDTKWHSSPWFMFAGVLVGGFVAVAAVRMQLKRLQ